MAILFDMHQRRLRRDRAAAMGGDMFLLQRAFEDVLERLGGVQRAFQRALLIGCADPVWAARLRSAVETVDVADPGEAFAHQVGGARIEEDAWEPRGGAYDLVVAIGTLDTVNDLSLALHLIRYSMSGDALLIGAVAGGETLPQLRSAMRAADVVTGAAAPHVHPRIEPSALAPLLAEAGFVMPVVDVDRVSASYPSLLTLVRDLRAMAATNVLASRPRAIAREAFAAATRAFKAAGQEGRTVEQFEILHFAAWTAQQG